jgi:hypothetical protein
MTTRPYIERDREIVAARARGERIVDLAARYRLSRARISQIIESAAFQIRHAEWERQKRYKEATVKWRAAADRVRDPEGDHFRDVWLIFTTPPDPRLDAMVSVQHRHVLPRFF